MVGFKSLRPSTGYHCRYCGHGSRTLDFHESGHGLDFQDESFALLVAEHPDEYRLLSTRVGYFLQPFYLLAQRDIPLLRQFSYLLLILGLYLNFHFPRESWRMLNRHRGQTSARKGNCSGILRRLSATVREKMRKFRTFSL